MAAVGRPWTQEADDELARLSREGTPINEIATSFGRTVGAIKSRLSKHDNARTGTVPHRNGLRTPVPQASGAPLPTESRPRQSYKAWTAADDQTLRDMQSANLAVAVMADRLGRTAGAIKSRLSKQTDASAGTLPQMNAGRHAAPVDADDLNVLAQQLVLTSLTVD